MVDLTILYVEDDEDMSEQVAPFRQKKCARVMKAANGREALEIYQKQRPDMEAEDEHGVAWSADSIRQKLKETPVIGRFDALIDRVHKHMG